MSVLPISYERRRLLSAYETIQTILGFGMFTIALISLVVKLLKNDKKKQPSLQRADKLFLFDIVIFATVFNRCCHKGSCCRNSSLHTYYTMVALKKLHKRRKGKARLSFFCCPVSGGGGRSVGATKKIILMQLILKNCHDRVHSWSPFFSFFFH